MRYALSLAVVVGISLLAFRMMQRKREPRRMERVLDSVAEGLDRASHAAEQARRLAEQGREVAAEFRR